jgi:putative ABC transport system ATP-binding protein
VIYFSSHQVDLGFDRFLYLEAHQQRFFDNFEDFCRAPGGKLSRDDAAPPVRVSDQINLVGE